MQPFPCDTILCPTLSIFRSDLLFVMYMYSKQCSPLPHLPVRVLKNTSDTFCATHSTLPSEFLFTLFNVQYVSSFHCSQPCQSFLGIVLLHMHQGESFLGIPDFHNQATVKQVPVITKILLANGELCFDQWKHQKNGQVWKNLFFKIIFLKRFLLF